MDREAEREYNAAYYDTHREGLRKSQAAYYTSHREAVNKKNKAYYEANREKVAARNKSPERRAVAFLSHCPDCTSTLEEVAAIYAAGIDATTDGAGKVGRGVHDLCLDHIPGGPAVGLIPGWLNRALSVHVNGNFHALLRYMEHRATKEAPHG